MPPTARSTAISRRRLLARHSGAGLLVLALTACTAARGPLGSTGSPASISVGSGTVATSTAISAGAGTGAGTSEAVAQRLIAFSGPPQWKPTAGEPATGQKKGVVNSVPVLYTLRTDGMPISTQVQFAIPVPSAEIDQRCTELAQWVNRVQTTYKAEGESQAQILEACASTLKTNDQVFGAAAILTTGATASAATPTGGYVYGATISSDTQGGLILGVSLTFGTAS
jgi:hypothetical protein